MEKLRLTLIYIALLLPSLAMAVSPGEVENVQLRDSRRYVSDMAGVLSPQALERADSILADIRSRTSAEVVMVIVDTSRARISTTGPQNFSPYGASARRTATTVCSL